MAAMTPARRWPALLVAALLAVSCATASAQSASPSQRLADFFGRYWEDLQAQYPEWGTFLGDHRRGDRLTDASAAARAERDVVQRRWLAEAQAWPRDGLSATERVSLDLLIGDLQRNVALQPFTGWRSLSIGSNDGLQTQLAGLLTVTPVDSTARVEQLLARLAAVPKRMDDEIARLREGLALGWVPPREVLQRALVQIDRQLEAKAEEGPFFEPFRRLPGLLPADERAALREAGRAAVERHVLPAMRKLRAFVADEYLPKAPAHGALSSYPEGARVYDLVVAEQTTTALGAREIHDIGLRELARLRAAMEGVMRDTAFAGGFTQFIDFLESDPRFGYENADAMLAHFRAIGARIDTALPTQFAQLPRAGWGVQAMPPHMSADRAEYYQSPTEDGTRGGVFFANVLGWKKKRSWEAETLVAHEAVPGHHLQSARALELGALPRFRRYGFYTAYAEGWALYAEALGFDLGLYRDPYARFGHLQWQAFRAARLVVDTGYHALGWSRQRCIDFMVERTGVPRAFVESEVDRYASNPGQALAYMIGKLQFDALRDRARQRLGARFDVRRFHNAVLDQGTLPLDTLVRVVDDWIEREHATAAP
jgi:uncharacterized protein (DUF885 family)